MQSSLSIFAQKYLCKCKDTYLILQSKYLHIYKDSFGAKILRDDCTPTSTYISELWVWSLLYTKKNILTVFDGTKIIVTYII